MWGKTHMYRICLKPLFYLQYIPKYLSHAINFCIISRSEIEQFYQLNQNEPIWPFSRTLVHVMVYK